MRNACLVDANLLVYAYDNSEIVKQGIAIPFLNRLAWAGRGVLTTQVLAEFYVAVTRRLPSLFAPEIAERSLFKLASTFPVLDMTSAIVLEAARGVREHQLSYWDAQVWSSAKLNQIPVVLTEDMPSMGVIEGVRFINPLGTDEQTQAVLASLDLAE